MRPLLSHYRVRWLLKRVPRRYVRRLPAGVAVPVLSTLGWPRQLIEDERVVEVPEPFRLDVYWLEIGGEEGPAASLFLEDDEILRLDCLPDTPHAHYGLAESRHRGPAEGRVYFPPGNVADHIDRAVFELSHNVAYCTGLHRRRSIRVQPVDTAAFERAAQAMGDGMRDLLRRHTP
jgi:hypothetical protein